jgi:hypothetical protein
MNFFDLTGRPVVRRRAVLLEEDELKPLGERPRLAQSSGASIPNCMFEIDEKPGLNPLICFVN